MKIKFREIRFWIFSMLLNWAIDFLPEDATETWQWLSKMPIEK
jgi:hypothetical protein